MLKRILIFAFLLIGTTGFSQKKGSQELDLMKIYMGNDRKTLVSQNINLNILQLRKFWPIFDWYEKERESLIDKKLTITQKYLANPDRISDIEVDLIYTQIVSLNKKLDEVREKAYEKLKAELGIGVAMRFIQVDNYINYYLSLELLKKRPFNGITSKEEREKLEEEQRKAREEQTAAPAAN